MSHTFETIKEYCSALIGDETAWVEINTAMAAHFKDGRHVTWNADWVNKVAALSSPEREAEIQKGIDNLVEIDAMLARGEFTELPVDDTIFDPEVQKIIDAARL